MIKYDDKDKYWYFNWCVNFRLSKIGVKILKICAVILSILFVWLYLVPLHISRHEFKDARGGAIAFAVNAALGVIDSGYDPKLLAKLKKIDIPEKELDSLACTFRYNKFEREQCKFVNHKSTNKTYETEVRGEKHTFPCHETDLMPLRECLRVEANQWLSNKEIELFTNREILDKYPHLLKIIEPILVRPCDYIPTEKDCDGMKDEKYLKSKIQYRRESLRCDEKIDVENREDIHLVLRGYRIPEQPGYIELTVSRRD